MRACVRAVVVGVVGEGGVVGMVDETAIRTPPVET